MSKPNLIEAAFAISWVDGTLSVTHMPVQDDIRAFHPDAAKAHGFAEQDGKWVRELTPEMVETEVQRIAVALGKTLVGYRELSAEETAAYFAAGDFRGDHVDTGKALVVDIDKARKRTRQSIRALRTDRFFNLDNAVKPLEIKAALGTLSAAEKRALTALEAQRQDLRDAPASPAIDAAETVEDLKAHIQTLA